MTKRGTELGATLRVWRDRLTPESAGMTRSRSRRVVGLRRTELSELTGISVDYVVRLEQGRATTPSTQVVAALARALQLTPAESDHLYRLAGLSGPSHAPIPNQLPSGVHRVLNRLSGAAVAVFAANWQLMWWNQEWAALLGDPSPVPPSLRNFARDTFPTGDDVPSLVRWPVTSLAGTGAVEAAVVSDLRRATGRFPEDLRLTRLIRQLCEGNHRFAELWAAGVVSAHRESHKIVHHPSVGPIEVDCDVLTDGDAEIKIVILTAASGSEDDTRLQLALQAAVDVNAAPSPGPRA